MSTNESCRQSVIQQAAELKPPVAAEVIDKYVDALMDTCAYSAMNWSIHESMGQGIRAAIEATGFVPIDQHQDEGLDQFAFIFTDIYLEGYVKDGEAMELCHIGPLQAYAEGVSWGATLEEDFREFLEEWPEFDRACEEEIRQQQVDKTCPDT